MPSCVILSICESLRDGVLHTCLGCFCRGFFIYSQRCLPLAVPGGTICFRCSCFCSALAGVGAAYQLFLSHSYPCSHELQTTVDFHCNFGEIVSTSRGPEFHIPSTSCNFWKSSNPISPFPRAIAISHTSTPKSPCSTKSQNKQNLVLMLHFRHLMHAKYSPDPSLVFQKGRVPSLL